MPEVYNPFDVFIVQRNSTSSSFEEVILTSMPNSYVAFDSSSRLVAITQSNAFTQSCVSASYALTASYALNANNTSNNINFGNIMLLMGV